MLDVLVIGAGGAGLCAALAAKQQNKKVLILCKTYPTSSQTVQAQGGINAVLNNKNESIFKHINDTKKAAHGLGCNFVIEKACNEAKNTIEYLDKIGVPFSRDENGNIKQRAFGASSEDRTCYSSDYTGLKILHTLYDKTIKEEINYLNEHLFLNFIIEDGKALGITALCIKTSNIKQILAKTIIVATGGYCNLYHGYTTNSNQSTGDGHNAALKAGLELSNMEYIQFHPTAMKGNNILISESARAEGGYLIDEKGKRFVKELESRDIVARAINEKLKNKEEVFLDLRHLGYEKIKETMPQERELAYTYAGIKIEEEILSINPAAHYSMGGIKTDINTRTKISNIFAVGECAQNGLHGANRIGGNSLLEIISFGRISGYEAAKQSDLMSEVKNKEYKKFVEDKKELENIFLIKKSVNFYDEKKKLGKIFFENLGLVKSEDSILEAIKAIKEIKNKTKDMGLGDKSKIYNKSLQELIEFRNMLDLSLHVASVCLNREESRGAHFREDYKNKNSKYQRNSLIIKIENNILCTYEVEKE